MNQMEWTDDSLFIAHYVNAIRELLVCNSVLFVCLSVWDIHLFAFKFQFSKNFMPKIPFKSVISAPFIIPFQRNFQEFDVFHGTL